MDMLEKVYLAIYEAWWMGEDIQSVAETIFLENGLSFDDDVYTEALLWLDDMVEDYSSIGGIG